MSNLRKASHAGTWYKNSREGLIQDFDQIFNYDLTKTEKSKIIVSPHAGYSYSLSQILTSFSHLSLTEETETVIVIGPSHTQFFENQIKLSQFSTLQTPLGALVVDVNAIDTLLKKNSDLFKKTDMMMELKEHSLEMQYPVLKYLLDKYNLVNVKVLPISIAHFDVKEIKQLISTIFSVINPKTVSIVVSCDFTHWGGHFEYYNTFSSFVDLMKTLKYKEPFEIENCYDEEIEEAHQNLDLDTSVKLLDLGAMLILSNYRLNKQMYDIMKLEKLDSWSSSLQEFKQKIPESQVEMFMEYLDETEATICGKWPLLFTLFLLENSDLVKHFGFSESPAYKFVDYKKSSIVEDKDDSSVTYVSGYIV
ncbi:hypothetical protein QEN19_001300 [Hanseniaspora menglaensis]